MAAGFTEYPYCFKVNLVVLDTKKRFPFLYPDIGVEERISIEEGLQKFVDWYVGYYGVK